MFDFIKNKGIDLSLKSEEKLIEFKNLLINWNNKFNLTSILDDEGIEIKHFEDSLIGEKYFPLNKKVVEIGSGGGFPSIPIMIVREDLNFTLVESVGKKCEFLKYVIEKLNLNGTVLNKRAEDIGRENLYRESFDIVTARAVAKLNTLSEYSIPLIKKGGLFIAYKSDEKSELIESKNAINVLGGKVNKIIDYELSNNKGKRKIYIIEKINKTPNVYPRGNGKERNKPL